MTRPQRIFRILRSATEPMTAAEIAARLGDQTNPVSSDLSRMVRCVQVVGRVQRGKGKPQRLFQAVEGAIPPQVPPWHRTEAAPVQAKAIQVRPRRIVVVDGQPMEIVWP